MRRILFLAIMPLIVFMLAVFWAHAGDTKSTLSGKIAVVGTGDSQALLRAMAKRFEETHPGTTVEVPDSIGSGGGVRSVAEGRAELGRIARPLKEKEKGYGLTYEVFAMSPVVIVTNSNVDEIDNLTSEQLIGIYSGEITHWKQVGGSLYKIYPVAREPGDSSKEMLYEKIPGLKKVINPAGKVFYTTPETIEAIVTHKNTIGYAPLAMVKNTDLRILAVDGVYPSFENVKNGSYELVVPFAIVYKGKPSPLADAFIGFLYSPEGEAIIREYGAVPLGEKK